MYSFPKKCFFFVHMRKCSYTLNCTWKFSPALSEGFTSYCSSLISRQNKSPKIDPKMLKQLSGIAIFRHALSFTQTNSLIISYKYHKQINKYLCCYELHLLAGLFLFQYQWYSEQVFMFGMFLVPISII